MKKIITIISLAAAAAITFSAKAELNGTGYYRINNYYTGRYIYVIDNTGSINISTTTADMGSIDLWLGHDRTISDPASVLYCVHQSGIQYDIRCQGTGIYQMVSQYVNLKAESRYPGTYTAYASAHGLTKYLFDGRSSTAVEQSYISDAGKNECKYWYITPIQANSDNYFGVKANTTVNGVNYASFFAEFPFSFASEGMQAFYVSHVDAERGYAVYKEITGVVPGSTPIFIKCNSTDPSDNRLDIGGSANALTDNKATGVYFNSEKPGHINQTIYNPSTMRVFGITSAGELGLITESYTFMPRNTFYVTVPANAPAQLTLVNEAEYEEIINNIPVEVTGVELSASELTLTIGETATLTASVLPESATDKNVSWTSSNTSVATVDNYGNITTVGVGTATITATSTNGCKGECKLTVNPVQPTSVTLSESSLQMIVHDCVTLTATVLPENATYKNVSWSSSNTAVATVDNDGKVTATGVGTATITATTTNGLTATCQVTATAIDVESVTLNYTELNLLIGETATLLPTILPENATYKSVSWTSSNTDVVSVDIYGKVTTVGVGEATITATATGGLTATCQVKVSPIEVESVALNYTEAQLFVGYTIQLEATVLPDNATYKDITWTSNDVAVATVTQDGLVKGIKAGVATIRATTKNGKSAACTITVMNVEASGIQIDKHEVTLVIDEMSHLTATLQPEDVTIPNIQWATSDADVVAVDANGDIVALAAGEAVITATCGTASDQCKVTVVKKSQTIVWNQSFDEVYEGDVVELTAAASSGLDVVYETNENASIEGNKLTVLVPGEVVVRATQPGDDRHNAAEPVELRFNALAGINDVVYANVKVTGAVAEIIISGKPDDVKAYIFTPAGSLVYAGTDSRVKVAANSLYIVRIGASSFKTITK